MTSRLLSEFKQKIESLTLIPSGGGCFELTADGAPVYSKLETGSFPDEAEIERQIAKRLG